ncbi:SMI1 / KNR4 family protein [compost metagenome]|uniref:SMI1/KNR4 family protein n=1 Tax=Pseudomonas asiatica TaxID=2219225 RepID=UPI000FC0AFC2
MKTLEKLVEEQQAATRPATRANIDTLESNLGFALGNEYREYLERFGVIAHDAYETYGLGVPDDYFLHVLNAYKDLASDASYPATAVPLLELGDGQYYLYDTRDQRVVLWATPNGGVVRTLDGNLEGFLIKHIFQG